METKYINEWLKQAMTSTSPGIDASQAFVAVYVKNYALDPLCALQFGYAVLQGKAIFLLLEEGQNVSPAVQSICKGIEVFERDDELSYGEATKRLAQTIVNYLDRHR